MIVPWLGSRAGILMGPLQHCAIPCIAGLLSAACGSERMDDAAWDEAVSPGSVVEVKGVSGNIAFVATSEPKVHVSVRRVSRGDDITAVWTAAIRHQDGLTICAVYRDLAGEPANNCVPGDRRALSNHGIRVDVHFTIHVPPDVRLIGRTVSGTVSAERVRNEAYLTTVSGDIRVSTTEFAAGSTESGSVTASVGRGDWNRNLHFSTTSGDVTVTIPSNTNAFVDAMAGDGTVESDFPLTSVAPGRLQGSLGRGGPTLTLSTGTGHIRLRRALPRFRRGR